ncbi:MAG: hypothetical protein N4A62_20575 [Marinisporobacter sp.]|jgi:hypothetical protein|nr:hypothetical protein [Marinisporobacter sp.]
MTERIAENLSRVEENQQQVQPSEEQELETEQDQDTDEGIMSLETFQERTNKTMRRRGETLQEIDKALKSFKDYEEYSNSLNEEQNPGMTLKRGTESIHRLERLKVACEKWNSEHNKKENEENEDLKKNKRYQPVQDLLKSVNEHIDAQEKIMRQLFSDKGIELGENISDYKRGLLPYDEFYEQMNSPEILKMIKLSKMRKIISLGFKDDISKDHKYLHKILDDYKLFDDKRSKEDTVSKENSTEKYTYLLNLERRCKDWLEAHQSKKGKLYTAMTLLATPSTVRRNFIGQLVQAGGAIDQEKTMVESSMNSFQKLNGEDEGSLKDSIHIQLPDNILRLEKFKELTDAGVFHRRGENIKAIDHAIDAYHKNKREGNDEQKKISLEKIFKNTTYWLAIHKEDTTASVEHRRPIVRLLGEVSEKLLQKENGLETESIEKIDARESADAIFKHKGIEVVRRDIPTKEDFELMTYGGKTATRGKNLKRIEEQIEKYHEAKDDDERIKIIQYMYHSTGDWLYIHREDQEKDNSAGRRFDVINALYIQIKNLLENKEVDNTGNVENDSNLDSSESSENEENTGNNARTDSLIEGKNKRIPTIGQFKKLTDGGIFSTRGNNLKKIDKNIVAYDKLRVKNEYNEQEQKQVAQVLKNLYIACRDWINIHAVDGDGTIGMRKPIIEKMIGEEGLIAQESAILMRDKILSKDVGLNQEFIESEDKNLKDMFDIKDEYSDSLKKEMSSKNIEAGITIGISGIPLKFTMKIRYDHQGSKEGYIDDYDQVISDGSISEDNIRQDISTKHNVSMIVSGKLIYILEGKLNIGLYGLFTKASAETVDDCEKLMSFSTYNSLRRKSIVPKWLTKKIYGEYEEAEKKQSQAIGILEKNEKNYIEDGNVDSMGGSASMTLVGSVEMMAELLKGRKRIDKETLEKALEPLRGEEDSETLQELYLSLSGREEEVEDNWKFWKSKEDRKRTKKNFMSKKLNSSIYDQAKDEDELEKEKWVRTPGPILGIFNKPKVTTELENGDLKSKRLEVGVDTDAFLTKRSLAEMSVGLIRQIGGSFEDKEGNNHFDIRALNLKSFAGKIEDRVDQYAPIVYMRNHGFKSLVKGLDAKVIVELDAKKGVLKLLIGAINFDKEVLMALTEAIVTGTVLALNQTVMDKIKLAFAIGSNSSTEELLGFWKLPNSHFEIQQ